jgi:hypothetical protein
VSGCPCPGVCVCPSRVVPLPDREYTPRAGPAVRLVPARQPDDIELERLRAALRQIRDEAAGHPSALAQRVYLLAAECLGEGV